MSQSPFVIFDLDNTLVDSLHLKSLRDARRWAEVYRAVPEVRAFAGIRDAWRALRQRGVYLAVVTHSPRPYASRVLEYVGLVPDTLVAYHDLRGRRKPSPYGYQLSVTGHAPQCGIAVGDEVSDLRAADAFGCRGVFAGWAPTAALTAEECQDAGWTYASHPRDLLDGLRLTG